MPTWAWFRDGSIRRKLMVTVLASTAAVLVMVFAFLITYESRRSRQALIESTATIADLVGTHSLAALLFEDRSAALETLRALRSEPGVLVAAIFQADGTLFADYAREGDARVPESLPEEPRIARGVLEMSRPIRDDDDSVGHVFIRMDASGAAARTQRYLGVALIALLAALGIAAILAGALQRSLSGPLARLLEHSDALTRGDLTNDVSEAARAPISSLRSSRTAATRSAPWRPRSTTCVRA